MPKAKKVISDPKMVVGYVRVSTDEQADSGLGLAAQRATVTAEAERRGWTLVAVHEDALSGKSLDRPGLAAALAAVESSEAGGIVVAKLDRLSRSLKDFALLMERAQKRGWNLVACDLGIDLSIPAGEFMANVMGSAAQWERRIIGLRTANDSFVGCDRSDRTNATSVSAKAIWSDQECPWDNRGLLFVRCEPRR